jgi:lipopolysaccharide/colanic/teichoic acid biosynthesis glycosyltransferase
MPNQNFWLGTGKRFQGETRTSEMIDRVEYDIWYIENWSLLLDIKIIYLTLFNVCSRGGKGSLLKSISVELEVVR